MIRVDVSLSMFAVVIVTREAGKQKVTMKMWCSTMRNSLRR